jgi:uncharacterized OB-fold protein
MSAKREDDFFWAGVDQGRLLAQICSECKTIRHPPAPMCAHCQSLDWEPKELSGRGTVHTWLMSRHPTQPDASPRIVLLVDLEEGVRVISNLVDCERVEIGDKVSLLFREIQGARLPFFAKVDNF